MAPRAGEPTLDYAPPPSGVESRGGSGFRRQEERRHPRGAPVLRRAPDQGPFRGSAGAGRLQGRAHPLRPEVRDRGPDRPQLGSLRALRPGRRATFPGALARSAGRGAPAAPDAPGAEPAAAHARPRRSHLACLDRPLPFDDAYYDTMPTRRRSRESGAARCSCCPPRWRRRLPPAPTSS